MANPQKVPAHSFTIGVKDNDNGDYVEIGGLTELQYDADMTEADTTDFDSGGDSEHIVVRRSRTVTMNGRRLEDPLDGERDDGQKIVEDLMQEVGVNSLGAFRIETPSGEEWTFVASVQPNTMGGGTDDTWSWGATLNVSGPISVEDDNGDNGDNGDNNNGDE